MDTLFILALLFLIGCFIFRKRLAVIFTGHKDKKGKISALPEMPVKDTKNLACKILLFRAGDYDSAKDMENVMDVRLEQCLSGLARQGIMPEVQLYADGLIFIYLVRYTF